MRIVYICDFFHPYAGYHPNLLTKYWHRFGNEVYMITSAMDRITPDLTRFFDISNLNEKDQWFEGYAGVKIIRVPLLKYVSGRSIYSHSIFKKIKEIDPDVIFVNGNDSLIGIQLIKRYKKLKSGLVTDSHMLEMASKNKLNKVFRAYYKKFITPIILKNNIPVIRTQDDNYVEKCLGIPLNKSPWISFGSDLAIFHPDKEARAKFRKENNISEYDFVVIYAGKLDESKGTDILVKGIQAEIKSKKRIVFLFVGNTEGEFGKSVEKSFSQSRYRIVRYPTQRYFELPQFYQASDIAVFPKQCSLSFFDVQACGLPVVFEDNNVNLDRASHHNALTYKSGDEVDFCKKIEYFSNLESKEYEEYSQNAFNLVKQTYNYETKAKEYLPYLEEQKRKKGR